MQHEQPPAIELPADRQPGACQPTPQLPPRLSEQSLDDAALAACPGDDEDVEVVRKWLRARADLAGLKAAVDQLKAGHDDDPRLIEKCNRAYEGRVEFEALMIEQAMTDWWPGTLLRQDCPH